MGSRGPIASTKAAGVTYPAGKPEAPDWLADEARTEYERAAELMGRALTLADMATLAVYAESYADFAQLTREIRKEGVTVMLNNGVFASNPKCSQRDAAAKRMQSAAAKLGFSPVDRARVPKSSDGKANPFSEYVK